MLDYGGGGGQRKFLTLLQHGRKKTEKTEKMENGKKKKKTIRARTTGKTQNRKVTNCVTVDTERNLPVGGSRASRLESTSFLEKRFFVVRSR